MTVLDEIRDGPMEYSHLRFVEFLEFLGRVAYAYYSETPHHLEWELPRKLIKILELVFQPVTGAGPVIITGARDEFVSDSDDDY